MSLSYQTDPDQGAEADQDVSRPIARDTAQLHSHLLRLVYQASRMQRQLDHLLEEIERSGSQVDVLAQHLTDSDRARESTERLAEMATRLSGSEEQLSDLADQVKKLSRAQFKANTLAEVQEQKTAEALAILQAALARREAAAEARVRRVQQEEDELRAEARAGLALSFLPVLDGLEAALDSGHSLLARRRREDEAEPAPPDNPTSLAGPPSFMQRLRLAFGEEPLPPPPATAVAPAPDLDAPLAAWLDGLELGRQRFLALLAEEDIRSIQPLGEPFDPRHHVAVEAVVRGDVPASTVVGVLRRGYHLNGRVLRYAEVVVSRAAPPPPRADDEPGIQAERGSAHP